MSGGNEIGISPALLQAITQTISMKNRPDGDSAASRALPVIRSAQDVDGAVRVSENFIISRDPNYQQIIKVEGKGNITGLSEALSAMGQQAFQSGNTILVVQNPTTDGSEITTQGIGEEHVYTTEVHEEVSSEPVGEEESTSQTTSTIHSTLVHPVESSHSPRSVAEDSKPAPTGSSHHAVSLSHDYSALAPGVTVTSAQSMSSVMTALASQILQQVTSPVGASADTKYRLVSQPHSSLVSASGHLTDIKPDPATTHSIATDDVTTHGVLLASPANLQRVVPTVIPHVSHSVPSPTRDVVVSGENVLAETVIHTTDAQAVVSNGDDLENEAPKKLRIVEVNEFGESFDTGTTTIIINPGDMQDGSVLKTISTEQGAIVYRAAQPASENSKAIPAEFGGGCPVCGDKVSGYHYGIYSCESCKGFFKRTVQNKKAFICHRNGECVITVANRKKCPACRFKRCLVAGMKLEAIREDRMRGGRSSYDGCSPHRPIKLPKETPKRQSSPQTRPNVIVNPVVIQTPGGSIAIPSQSDALGTVPETSIPAMTSDAASRPVKAASSKSSSEFTPIVPRPVDLNQVQPQTPQLLEDLMAVESLMLEDEEEQSCCEGKMVDNDPDLFGSLLHFADHCLYKIVRWARNLPDFSNVSTDDQIILLQNCWAELLCLCCCWKSIRCPPEILKLSHGRLLTRDQASLMGVGDEIQRMLDYTDSLRLLETDNYEFVAIKALLLFSPDVKNLKDKTVVRRYQDQIIEALMIYTTTNSPGKAGKFCELLARIPELTRACVVGKEQLNQRQLSGQVPQHSLLSELLKGDITVA